MTAGVFVSGAGAVTRFVATGRWGCLAAAGKLAAGLAVMGQPYDEWLAGIVGASVAIAAVARSFHKVLQFARDRLPESVMVLVVLAGLITAPWRPAFEAIPAYAWVVRAFPLNLLPVSVNAQQLTDLQLGYGLWALLATGGLLGLWRAM